MNTVISKISEIESAAVAIMDDANARKKAFAKEMEERTAAFDAELEAETAKQLDDLRGKMEVAMHAQLDKQKSEADAILKLLDENYNANHTALAKELFQKMIEE